MLPFMQDIYTRLDDLARRFETRFDNLERSLGQIKDTLADLNTGHTPCRYDTEEREGILQGIDILYDDHTTSLQSASKDLIDDLEKERDKAIDQVRDECNEITIQCKDEVEEAQKNIHAIKTRLTKTLQNASMRFDGTLVLDI